MSPDVLCFRIAPTAALNLNEVACLSNTVLKYPLTASIDPFTGILRLYNDTLPRRDSLKYDRILSLRLSYISISSWCVIWSRCSCGSSPTGGSIGTWTPWVNQGRSIGTSIVGVCLLWKKHSILSNMLEQMTACTWLYPRIMYKRVNSFCADHYSHDNQSTFIHVTWHVFFPLIIMSVIVSFYQLLLLAGDIMHRLYRRHNFSF